MPHRRTALLAPLPAAGTRGHPADPGAALRARQERRWGADPDGGVHEFGLPDGRAPATARSAVTIVEIAPARAGFARAVVEGNFLRREIPPAGRALLRETAKPRMIGIAGLRPRRSGPVGPMGERSAATAIPSA